MDKKGFFPPPLFWHRVFWLPWLRFPFSPSRTVYIPFLPPFFLFLAGPFLSFSPRKATLFFFFFFLGKYPFFLFPMGTPPVKKLSSFLFFFPLKGLPCSSDGEAVRLPPLSNFSPAERVFFSFGKRKQAIFFLVFPPSFSFLPPPPPKIRVTRSQCVSFSPLNSLFQVNPIFSSFVVPPFIFSLLLKLVGTPFPPKKKNQPLVDFSFFWNLRVLPTRWGVLFPFLFL